MSYDSNIVHINNMKETRALINKIKNIGLSNKGIIFGGLVRDEIIAQHYKHLFTNKDLDFNEFWNIDYDPETSKRTIIPNDMDIYFKYPNDIQNFIKNLDTFCKSFYGSIVVREVFSINDLNYIKTPFQIKHNKIKVFIYIGRTINYRGIKLTFNIDTIQPDNSNNEIFNPDFDLLVSTYEPPFNHLDFLCNIFIMEKINDKNVIRVSNNTGTPIDSMPFTLKNKFISRVIEDIIEHKTQFVRHIEDNYNVEYINTYRILKMIDRQYYWNITNIPFTIFIPSFIKDITINDISCCICLENINNDIKTVSINMNKSNNNLIHYDCFLKYMYMEQSKKYRNPHTGYIECRCPLRNPFNFKDCYLSVNYI